MEFPYIVRNNETLVQHVVSKEDFGGWHRACCGIYVTQNSEHLTVVENMSMEDFSNGLCACQNCRNTLEFQGFLAAEKGNKPVKAADEGKVDPNPAFNMAMEERVKPACEVLAEGPLKNIALAAIKNMVAAFNHLGNKRLVALEAFNANMFQAAKYFKDYRHLQETPVIVEAFWQILHNHRQYVAYSPNLGDLLNDLTIWRENLNAWRAQAPQPEAKDHSDYDEIYEKHYAVVEICDINGFAIHGEVWHEHDFQDEFDSFEKLIEHEFPEALEWLTDEDGVSPHPGNRKIEVREILIGKPVAAAELKSEVSLNVKEVK